ncbi:hypothetical protein [Microbulbifer taiwanensis]|uniref:DUF1285 family C-terminal domain-containing protein n=1 Tax=Microbulbifer taiwanensis TaxID=986746 RepID=UPI00361FC191
MEPFGDPPQPVPYIEVRDGLRARISREAFYQLVDWAEERAGDNCGQLWLHSDGEEFLLGEY